MWYPTGTKFYLKRAPSRFCFIFFWRAVRRESEVFCGSREADVAFVSFCFRFRCLLGFRKVSELFFGVGGLGKGFRFVDGEIWLTSSEILHFFFCLLSTMSVDLEVFPSGPTSFNVATSFSKLISADSSPIDRGEGRFRFFDKCDDFSLTGAFFIDHPGTWNGAISYWKAVKLLKQRARVWILPRER